MVGLTPDRLWYRKASLMADSGPSLTARLMKIASKVEPHEVRAVLLSFCFVFVLMTAYYILRPIRDALSSNWTDAELSTLYTATFLFSAVSVTIYGAACSRFKIGILVPGVYGFFAASFVLFYAVIQAMSDAALVNKIFFVWVSVFGLFHVSVFWTFMADVFTKQQAPRLFGFIAAGSSIGAIAGPAIAFSLAATLERNQMLLISAALLTLPYIQPPLSLLPGPAFESERVPVAFDARAAIESVTLDDFPDPDFRAFHRVLGQAAGGVRRGGELP